MAETMRQMTPLEIELHDFRKEIDANIKKAISWKHSDEKVSTIEEEKMQREISLVITKLQEAKMWAGKILEAIGSPFPEELRDEAPKE